MNQLMASNIEMTSLDMSVLTNKNHSHVMRDIRKEIEELGDESAQSIFGLGSYLDRNQQKRPCYRFGKQGAMQLALKYDAKTRYKVIKRIEELENSQQPMSQLEVLQGTIGQLVKQEKRVTQLESDVNNISNIVSITNVEWRKKVDVVIKKIAQKWTGIEPYRSVRNYSYERLEERAGCNLNIRLNNRKERATARGMTKSYVNKISKLDCIAEEKRLVEIYIQVVKEMAIKFKVDINDFEEVI